MSPSLAELGPSLIAIAGLLAASAFFSGTEVAMFSLRRVDREQIARSGDGVDALVHRFVSHPRRLIATILIGNEVVNVSISAMIASIVQHSLGDRGLVAVVALSIGVALPLILLFGEITPKTVAMKAPLAWARAAARPLWLFWYVVAPFRGVVRFVSSQMLRPFGVDPKGGAAHAALGEAEFKALVDAGSAEGEVNARERRLIHKVFEFADKRVAQVMVPAKDVFLLAYNVPMSRMLREISVRGLSRVPIYQKTRDNILGLLYAKDLVGLAAGLAPPRRLGELLHEPLFVPRNMRLERLFEVFKERKIHMALVVDEYGKFVGIVTMEDLLEELFGPIRDEKETRERLRSQVSTPPTGVSIAPTAAAAHGPPPPGFPLTPPTGVPTSAVRADGGAAAEPAPAAEAVPEAVREPEPPRGGGDGAS
jgi:putative hemolysin